MSSRTASCISSCRVRRLLQPGSTPSVSRSGDPCANHRQRGGWSPGLSSVACTTSSSEPPDPGSTLPSYTFELPEPSAAGARTATGSGSRRRAMRPAAPDADLSVLRGVLGSFLFSVDTVHQPVRTLAGGEKTRLAWSCSSSRARTSCCWTDRPTTPTLPAATRCWRHSPATDGALLLVTHQEGPVQALQPQRFVLMPDGIADW